MYNDLKSAIEFSKTINSRLRPASKFCPSKPAAPFARLKFRKVTSTRTGSCRAGQSSRLPIPLSPSPQISVPRTIAASLPHKVISISFRQPPREGSLPRPFAYATDTAFRFIGLPCPTKRTIRLPSRRSPDIRSKNNYFPHSCVFWKLCAFSDCF